MLGSIREVVGKKGRIITVVGAGGNRDKGKRPIMAQEAVKISDRVILTSDNPRFEEPEDILSDMRAGLSPQQLRQVLSISDRREGHEDYQEIKGVKYHFNDKEEVEKIFKEYDQSEK